MITLKQISIKKFINKAYLKTTIQKGSFEAFLKAFSDFLSKINNDESEEHNKNIVRDFLMDSFYPDSKYCVNTKGKIDLVIHDGNNASDPVSVIIESKSPTNASEMITLDSPNRKGLHEALLYYIEEREQSDEIKSIIITNTNEWFIFKSNQFEQFYKDLKKDYAKWSKDQKVSSKTEHFYGIAKKYFDNHDVELDCVYFNIADYAKRDENKLIQLYKLFSPEGLLRKPVANDSNSLNRRFYEELLYIIGLEETKDGSKRLIGRKEKGDRDSGSLLENTIKTLENNDSLKNIEDIDRFGVTKDERLYNIALELNITWINRILFLKLLEAQLINYHEGDAKYKFLKPGIITEYDDLSELFHATLAKKIEDRDPELKEAFKLIPYLNSSLFDISDLELKTIRISNLKDKVKLAVHPHSVFGKDYNGHKEISSIEYLLNFLDAYDFSSEGSELIRERKDTIINASVLGLIFEKINGYKDGSYYTPGFITMYMAHETLRRAVVQKYNEAKETAFKDYEELKASIDYSNVRIREEVNEIINSLRICDPAVGSGHFLVSCLNELITIKADLKVLTYKESRQRVQDYVFEIENDELIITDENSGELFQYHLNPKGAPISELQALQETLFHEKQTLIENCLFGVDINPNSVNICRLRLWIELLKNAYYIKETKYAELQTLPNIDINIKQGNSLVSKFKIIDENFSYGDKRTLELYKLNVAAYKNVHNKEERDKLKRSIEDIKNQFEGMDLDPFKEQKKKIKKLDDEIGIFNPEGFFTEDNDKKKDKIQKLTEKLNKFSAELEAQEAEYETVMAGAFEWRFEFPEVLDEEGNFAGFDMVIGNPPYIFGGNEGITAEEKRYYKENYEIGSGKINLFTIFIEKGYRILNNKGIISLIIPNTFLRVTSYSNARQFLVDNFKISSIYNYDVSVFDDAVTTSIVFVASKTKWDQNNRINIKNPNQDDVYIYQSEIITNGYIFSININSAIGGVLKKIRNNNIILGDIAKELIFGIVITNNQDKVVSYTPRPNWKPFLEGKDIGSYYISPINKYINYKPELLHRPRTKEIFEVAEKIVIQRITGGDRPLKAAYDDQMLYNKESINNIILLEDCSFSIKYILALLNSTLLNWFYATVFTNKSKLTVNLAKEYLAQIPIASASSSEQRTLKGLVDKIISTKKNNPDANTSELESQIDQIVYQLYGLTEEEIKIVEGA